MHHWSFFDTRRTFFVIARNPATAVVEHGCKIHTGLPLIQSMLSIQHNTSGYLRPFVGRSVRSDIEEAIPPKGKAGMEDETCAA